MEKAEVYQILRKFENYCNLINGIFPPDFWDSNNPQNGLTNCFPYIREISEDVNALKTYIMENDEYDLAEQIVAFAQDDSFGGNLWDVFMTLAYTCDDDTYVVDVEKIEAKKALLNCRDFIQDVFTWLLIEKYKVKRKDVWKFRLKNGVLEELESSREPLNLLPEEFGNWEARWILYEAHKAGLLVFSIKNNVCEWKDTLSTLAYFAQKISDEFEWDGNSKWDEVKKERIYRTNYKPIIKLFPEYDGEQLKNAKKDIKKRGLLSNHYTVDCIFNKFHDMKRNLQEDI